MPSIHRRRPRVISGQRQRQVVVIASQQGIEITRAARDILVRPQAVAYAQLRRGLRHQLHEPLRAFPAHRRRVAAALCSHDAGQQIHVQVVLCSGARKQLVKLRLGQVRMCAAELGLAVAEAGIAATGSRNLLYRSHIGRPNFDKIGAFRVGVKPHPVAVSVHGDRRSGRSRWSGSHARRRGPPRIGGKASSGSSRA